VRKELQQLHDRDVLYPMKANETIYEAKRHALPYLMFLKQKRSVEIKGRGCAKSR
jgi:hypothetical protein